MNDVFIIPALDNTGLIKKGSHWKDNNNVQNIFGVILNHGTLHLNYRCCAEVNSAYSTDLRIWLDYQLIWGAGGEGYYKNNLINHNVTIACIYPN